MKHPRNTAPLSAARTSFGERAAAVAALACFAGFAAAQNEYSFTLVDAFTPGYSLRETYLFDINEAGVGCGTTTIQNGPSLTYTGFVWSASAQTPIPVSWPRGINNAGLVVGVNAVYDLGTGQTTTPPALAGTYGGPVFQGVSDPGVAVGYIQTCNCSNSQGLLQIPYVWSAASGARTLAVPGATGARRINSAGRIVGWIGGNSPTDAFVYDLATETYTRINTLFPPMPNGWTPRSTAEDISENDVVAGSHLGVDAVTTYGYTWHVGDPQPTLLPFAGAGYANTVRPSGINAAGTVVGSIYLTSGSSRAFVYDAAHGTRDLNTLTTPPAGFVLLGAYKVNDLGQIVGYGQGGGGMYKSFVLTPLPSCIADFNRSGGTPDDADVAAFFEAWSNGEESADVNASGGTPDDADIAYFFERWTAGC